MKKIVVDHKKPTRGRKKKKRHVIINMDDQRTINQLIAMLQALKTAMDGESIVIFNAGYNNVDMNIFEV